MFGCSKQSSLSSPSVKCTSHIQCENLKYNVIIVGWLGVIISSVILCSSMLTLHMESNIKKAVAGSLSKITCNEQQFLMNLLAIFSSILYGLSLINTGVSLLLLIGIARNISSFLYPWLIFHGVLFGVGLYLGIFYAAAGLFIDLSSCLMCFLVFTLILVIFYKIYHEVFTLFRVMQYQNNDPFTFSEEAWTGEMPHFYTPRVMPRMAECVELPKI